MYVYILKFILIKIVLVPSIQIVEWWDWMQGAAADDSGGVWVPAWHRRSPDNQTAHKNETGNIPKRSPICDLAVFGIRWICQGSIKIIANYYCMFCNIFLLCRWNFQFPQFTIQDWGQHYFTDSHGDLCRSAPGHEKRLPEGKLWYPPFTWYHLGLSSISWPSNVKSWPWDPM